MFGKLLKKRIQQWLLVLLLSFSALVSPLWAEEKTYQITETQKIELEQILKNYEEIQTSYQELQTDYLRIIENLESSSKDLRKKNLKTNFIVGGVCLSIGICVGAGTVLLLTK